MLHPLRFLLVSHSLAGLVIVASGCTPRAPRNFGAAGAAGDELQDGGTAHAGSSGAGSLAHVGGAGSGTAGRMGSAGASGSRAGGGGDSNGGDGSGSAEGTDLPDGTACKTDGQCESKHCADGVCCNTACDGQCESCKESGAVGECSVVTGDPLPAHTPCTGTGPCKGQCDGTNGQACAYHDNNTLCADATCASGGVTPKSVCNGAGACTTPNKTTCPDGQCASDGSAKCATSCTSTSCDTGSYCDTGTGACIQTLDTGEICSADAQCTSKVCADGVCCNKECTGCSACTLALNGQGGSARNGQCLPVVAGKAAPHSACAATANAPCGQNGLCDGANGCQYPSAGTTCADPSCSGSTLKTSTCDSSHVCAAKNEACPNSLVCASTTQCKTGSCSVDKDCAAGYCNAGTCSTSRKTGDACSGAGECPNGYCVDGYCCSEKCDGECQTCKETPGQCQATSRPRKTCAGTGTGTCDTKYCDGSHASCVFPTGTACPDQCKSDWTAVMSSTCNGSGACGAGTPTSCGAGQYCSTSTSQCVNRLSTSSACSKDAQCSSAKCCSNVCADTNTDNNNCGGCGIKCGANRHCDGGSCACDHTMSSACGSTCGSWNFESGPGSTENWTVTQPHAYDVGFVKNGARRVVINSTHPASGGGSYSLAADVEIDNAETWSSVVGVQVCATGHETNLAGLHLSGSVYFAGPAMDPSGSKASVLGWGPDTDMSMDGHQFLEQNVEPNRWYDFTVILGNPPLIDHIGIQFVPGGTTPWTGTMYIDNVKFL